MRPTHENLDFVTESFRDSMFVISRLITHRTPLFLVLKTREPLQLILSNFMYIGKPDATVLRTLQENVQHDGLCIGSSQI